MYFLTRCEPPLGFPQNSFAYTTAFPVGIDRYRRDRLCVLRWLERKIMYINKKILKKLNSFTIKKKLFRLKRARIVYHTRARAVETVFVAFTVKSLIYKRLK